jgi:hypothetical protein
MTWLTLSRDAIRLFYQLASGNQSEIRRDTEKTLSESSELHYHHHANVTFPAMKMIPLLHFQTCFT